MLPACCSRATWIVDVSVQERCVPLLAGLEYQTIQRGRVECKKCSVILIDARELMQAATGHCSGPEGRSKVN